MGFEQGHAKKGGRKPSTPNKRTAKLIEVLEEHGYNPVAELIEWADAAKRCFEDASSEEAPQWARLGIQSALGVLPYIYPKRKPAEGQDILTPEQAQGMSTEDLVKHGREILNAFDGEKQ